MVFLTHQSAHFKFLFEKDSCAHRDIVSISKHVEALYTHIESTLKLNQSSAIDYYLYESKAQMVAAEDEFDTPPNSFSKGNHEIHALYAGDMTAIGSHELVHILSYQAFGKPKQPFIREGLAMFFDPLWMGIEIQQWVKVAYELDRNPDLSEIMTATSFRGYPERVTYPLAGAFTQYLIESFGMSAYLEWFKSHEASSEGTLETIFNHSLDALEDAFETTLSGIQVDETVRYEILKSYWDNV